MEALKEILGQGSAWFPIIIAFVALPGFYIILAIDVHKDYAELIKFQISDVKKFRAMSTKSLLKKIEDELYIFELDWWLVAATGILLVAIASLSDLIELSSQFPTCTCPNSKSQCDGIQGIARLYCVLVGLLLSFRIAWARIAAAKQLRVFYAALRA